MKRDRSRKELREGEKFGKRRENENEKKLNK